MFEKEAKNYAEKWGTPTDDSYACCRQGFIDGAEYGYNLAKEEMDYLNKHWRSEEERKENEVIPRHYLEEYASLLGKTYWELLDEIKKNIDAKKEIE